MKQRVAFFSNIHAIFREWARRSLKSWTREGRTVRLWLPMTGRLVRLARLKVAPRVVTWSPDGKRILVGCNDGRLRVMDPDSLEIVSDHRGLDGRIHALGIHHMNADIVVGGARILKLGW